MTDNERETLKQVLRRMYMTKDGETLCLSSDEVNVVLLHIEDLEEGVDE